MEYVQSAVAAGGGMLRGKAFGNTVNVRPIGRNNHDGAVPNVFFEFGQPTFGILFWKSLGAIFGKLKGLKSDRLPKFKKHQTCNMERFIQLLIKGNGLL